MLLTVYLYSTDTVRHSDTLQTYFDNAISRTIVKEIAKYTECLSNRDVLITL